MEDDHYALIIQFLVTGVAPEELSMSQKKQLVVKDFDFQLIDGHLYKMELDEILQRCVLPHEKQQILEAAHARLAGEHYGGHATTWKVFHTRILWPTLHNDAIEYAMSCDICQHVGKPSWQDEMSLVSQVTLQPFDKWAIDFVGRIN